MVPHPQSSAAGVLALLSESEPVIRQHALKSLITLVPQFWTEISEHIALIESIYEGNELSSNARALAALLASKIYYYLEDYDEALSFALGAGSAFEKDALVSGNEEYAETIVSRAIDRYIEARSQDQTDKVDPRLRDIIEGIFRRCIEDGDLKQAIGIALESRRLDVISHIFAQTRDTSLLAYAMEVVLENNFSLLYRDEVLNFLYPLFPPLVDESGSPYIHTLMRLLVTLSSPSLTVPLIVSLVPKQELMAYQLAFDLVSGGAQDFLESVRKDLPEGDEDTKATFDTLRAILSGHESVQLYLEFLRKNNKTDLLILKNTKDFLEARSSVYHTAVTFQNAFMHAGTGSDHWLRSNLDWLGYAANWGKFTATAALGVIHKGNFQEGMTILGPYLPNQNGGESNLAGAAYSEGGSLFALGLVNAGVGSGQTVENFLREILKAAQGEIVQHGAALGLGVAGIGGHNAEAYDDLKQVLFSDSAIAGEGAGYAMGLIMLGTGDATCADEMLTYARETQHEKIIRSLSIGLAFLFYGRQEQADGIVKELLEEKDPILRYGAVYTLALAYAGTSNNEAIRKLLHVAVSDTSDDVRRAAVTSLAFLLFKNPTQVPRIVQLLSESYNPHVRCGATLALGIACAGTGLQDAVDILEPMTKDSVDFVRQGAFIALGMVLVQQSEAVSPSITSTRALYTRIISNKHEDPMARFGAALGQSFIDAGGRNVTISLQSRAGTRNTSAIVGMTMFCQFWYWYPLTLCASLAFEPTGIIGLTKDIKVPKFDLISNAKPSLFAYPPSTTPPKKETAVKVAAAVLSTTAKEEKPEGKKDTDIEMKSDEPPATSSPEGASDSQQVDSKPIKRKEPGFETIGNFTRVTPAQSTYVVFPSSSRYQPVRPLSTRLPTSSRTGRGGKSIATSLASEKYAGGGGIIMLIDTQPEEATEYVEAFVPPPQPPVVIAGNPDAAYWNAPPLHISLDENVPDADPPQPFEYPFDEDT
ncbi:26S proteasome regulatory complex non-ATPase subcomplex Rpn2/Psmd1 subunit [Amylostereum chailletii]|nr:26S proteasome regulatory complex non-ATPase subcomplex Rpn2/Psmd1 subunit [Amylostereum chailletii]